MKKIYLSIIALAVGGTVAAQSTFDFESYTLAPESYDNGGPTHGGADFVFTEAESIRLTNFYDTAWGGYWSGYAISNTTDITTQSVTNQYSSVTGTGAAGSANYAVYTSSGIMSAESPNTQITEFKVTNTAWTKLVMENGNQFSKVFGSPNGANGQPDGTNGEDFFVLWIMASNDAGDLDSIDFYLADYRFADSTMDYIVDTWNTIDLTTAFSFPVTEVNFKFISSDQSFGFNNTPEYIAIDDIKTAGITSVASNDLPSIDVYPNPASEKVYVNAPEGQLVITDLQGNLLVNQNHMGQSTIDVSQFSSGIYVIRWSNASDSYTNRIVID
ncbi:MAG: DUF4465 domain-containing protein [Fluviicola sp.]